MTNEEAIKIITDEIKMIKKGIYTADMDTTIWVSNRIEALEMAIKAMERDTPKECKMFRDTCECVHSVFPHMRYCDQCGKRLVWK